MPHRNRYDTFEKHPGSFIAFEMLCSSSQLRRESFMLHEKSFPFYVKFSSLSRNGRWKYVLNTRDPSEFNWFLARTMDRRYTSPDQNRFHFLAALSILETASSNPLTLAVCIHYVSLLHHSMNPTVRFIQKSRV